MSYNNYNFHQVNTKTTAQPTPPSYYSTTTNIGYSEAPPPYVNKALGPPTKGGSSNNINPPPPPYQSSLNNSSNNNNSNIYSKVNNNNINNNVNSRNSNNQETNLRISQQQEVILLGCKEVKLYNSINERESFENLAELYSIIRATEVLEKAYIRDDVTPKDYTTSCSKLIAQFKSSQTLLKDNIRDIPSFMKDYDLNCKAAYDRLVNKGYPATLDQHTTDTNDSGAMAKNVAEAVQTFITTMDSIRLKMVAVDNIHPYLSDLMECLNRNTWLPKSFDGKEKIMSWISTLNRMKANDELDEDQTRQLLFDLESAYNVFYKAII